MPLPQELSQWRGCTWRVQVVRVGLLDIGFVSTKKLSIHHHLPRSNGPRHQAKRVHFTLAFKLILPPSRYRCILTV